MGIKAKAENMNRAEGVRKTTAKKTTAKKAAAKKEKRTLTPEEKAARLASMRATLTRLETEAAAIMSKGDEMTTEDKKNLLSNYLNVAYHEGGKIESLYSVDASTECEFCAKMRGAAACNPLMICGDCYAAADAEYKEAAARRHALNMHILSEVLFTVEELKVLNIPEGARVRFNEDGDTRNQTHAQNLLRLISARRDVNFGYFMKNTPAVEKGLHAEGVYTREQLHEKYPNCCFVQSSIFIGIPARAAWFSDYVFTVYPDAVTTAAAIASGAWACNGRKCKNCGFRCYKTMRKTAEEAVHIAEVLRASKARRAECIAALARYNAAHACRATA